MFDAVVNPEVLSTYFVRESSGRLEEGATVMWEFAEHPGAFPVSVRQVVDNERIVFLWESNEGGYDTTVEMLFSRLEDDKTMVQIKESGWKDTPKGIESSYCNCGGWMHMLCALKARLEHDINLRAGGI